MWPLFSVKACSFHQPELPWFALSGTQWEWQGVVLLAHRGRQGREKWEMLQAGPGEGLVSHHALLHFPDTLFPFIFPMRWSGQSLSEITGVKLRSHKCEGEEKVNIHCWTRDGIRSLCYRVRENTVFEVHLCLIFTGKYAAKLFKARLPSDWFKIMSEQSSKCIFSTDCYNHGLLLLKGIHLNQAGWVPEGHTQLSFCCGYTWALSIRQRAESQNH